MAPRGRDARTRPQVAGITRMWTEGSRWCDDGEDLRLVVSDCPGSTPGCSLKVPPGEAGMQLERFELQKGVGDEAKK